MERIAEMNRRLALTDPLTGLPNRRHLELHMARVLASGGSRPCSLVVFDVDGFKRFNDRHGYVAGDRALAAVGAVLSRTCAHRSAHPGPREFTGRPDSGRRPVDRPGPAGCSRFPARLGGDEFVVVLADGKADRTRGAADRVARAVARHPWLASRGIAVSFGLAARDAGTRGWQDLLAAADRDLRRRRAAARRLPAVRGFRYLWTHAHGSRRPFPPAPGLESPPRPA